MGSRSTCRFPRDYIERPMGPVSFTYSARVPAPIDKVFALISDPMRMPEWLPRCGAAKAKTYDTDGNRAPCQEPVPRRTYPHQAADVMNGFCSATPVGR